MSVPDRQLLTNELIAMLKTATTKLVGDHKAPAGVPAFVKGQPAPPPYSVVFTIPGGGYWGPGLSAPDSNADFTYQVDSVGFSRSQAEWLADRVRRSILARTATGAFQVAIADPAGWRIADRAPDGGAGGVQVGGDAQYEVYSIAERFVLRVVAA